MNDLDQFPSMRCFGEQLDELAARDAARLRMFSAARLARPATSRRLTPVTRSIAAIFAVGALAYAVPPTRAAVESLYDSTVAHWLSGEDSTAPGRAARTGEDLPNWLASQQAMHGRGEERVLAEAGDDKLVALRQGDLVTFGVADFSETGSVADLRQSLSGQQIMPLALGRFVPNGRHYLRSIFGLVSNAITRIQFNYADGTPPAGQDHLNGAFGFMIQTNRRPSSLTGYDDAGRLIARKDYVFNRRDFAFRYCPGIGGCEPWIEDK